MPRQSQRVRKRTIIWEEAHTSPPPRPAKKVKKNDVEVPKTTLANTDAAAEVAELSKQLDNAPYDPPINVPESSMAVLATERTPFDLFMRFLGWNSVAAIILATNARANAFLIQPAQRHSRKWSPLTEGELLLWLGLLFYMINPIQRRRHEYWNSSRSVLDQWMGRTRWEQIHRFLTFSMDYIDNTPPSDAPWYTRLEPVLSNVRGNCQTAIIPSAWLTIDEVMVRFSGRTKHIVKAPNKPIKIGYKI
jgi:hypothetical protein